MLKVYLYLPLNYTGTEADSRNLGKKMDQTGCL